MENHNLHNQHTPHLDAQDGILYFGSLFFLELQTIQKNTQLAQDILNDLYRPLSNN